MSSSVAKELYIKSKTSSSNIKMPKAAPVIKNPRILLTYLVPYSSWEIIPIKVKELPDVKPTMIIARKRANELTEMKNMST